MEIEKNILFKAREYKGKFNDRNVISIATGYLTRMKFYLKADKNIFDIPPGKNFSNGYFIFSEHKLYPHCKERFVTSVSDIAYSTNECLAESTKSFLKEFFI